MHELTILSRDAEIYRHCLRQSPIEGFHLVQSSSEPNEIDPSRVKILLGEPDLAASIVDQCQHLQWLQSTWAGNTPLLNRTNCNYVLTGVKGIFSSAIKEYVSAYLLHFSRAINEFHPRHMPCENLVTPTWQQPAISSLMGKTLGVLGTGSLGKSLIDVARCFGMRLVGLNRSGHAIEGFDQIYTSTDKLSFADSLDYVVNLMPETPQTRHIIDAEFLSALPSSAVLINAGRGSAIDNEALIHALDTKQIKAAVLDVFEQEPLPEQHEFWQHPGIWVTHHTAAISDPEAVFRVFKRNIERWVNAEPLEFIIDFTKGY